MPITKQIIQRFYALLQQRDLEAVEALFAEEIDWYIPGAQHLAPWLGKRGKRSDVPAFFNLLLQNITSKHFVVDRIFSDGPHGVATGEFVSTMLASGKEYASPFAALFTVQAGKIAHYRFLEDSFGLALALTETE